MEYIGKHQRALSQVKRNSKNPKSDFNFISVSRLSPTEAVNKTSLKIRMPKVKFERKNLAKVEIQSNSPLRNHITLLHPELKQDSTRIYEGFPSQRPAQRLPPIKDRIKVIEIPLKHAKSPQPGPSNQIRTLLPTLKKKSKKKSQNPIENSIYFELLGFFIKKHLDYNKLYAKIDSENKGWIDPHDFTNYFYMNEINCNIQSTVNSIFSIVNYLTTGAKVTKRVFFALCSAFEYDIPEDPKVLTGESLVRLQSRVQNFSFTFKEYAVNGFILKNDIFQVCNEVLSGSVVKSIELVFSEPVDFARFLTCLPFFMWVRTLTIA